MFEQFKFESTRNFYYQQRGEDVQLEYIKGRFDHFLDLQRKDHQSKGLKEKHRVRILPILLRSFFPEVVLAALLKIVNDVLLFAAPQILRLIIRVLTDGDYSWKGICVFSFESRHCYIQIAACCEEIILLVNIWSVLVAVC